MTVALNVNCGCGYKTGSLEEAVKHSEAKLHRMTISGTIIPPPPANVVHKVTVVEKPVSEDLSAIEQLRSKIGNGR